MQDKEIKFGEQYRHIHTGRIVTVVSHCHNVWGVIGLMESEAERPVFASDIEPFIKKVTGHQTLIGSIVESFANICVGFSINFVANMLILPLFGFHDLTLGKNFIIGMLYTVISLVRSFIIRRWFNGLKWGNK